MAIMVEQARMEEERRRIMMQRELEERQRREAAEMQLRMEEIQRAQETEGEEEDKEQETGVGPSVPKKRKMDDKVSFVTITERKQKLTKIFFKMVESNGKKIVPPSHQCEGAGATCYGKTRGPGCWRCSQQKIGCSVVEARKRKGKETEVIKVKQSRKGNRLEMGEMDRRTEAMEAMVVEMRRIVDGVENRR